MKIQLMSEIFIVFFFLNEQYKAYVRSELPVTKKTYYLAECTFVLHLSFRQNLSNMVRVVPKFLNYFSIFKL